MTNTIVIEPKDFGKLKTVEGNRMISNSHVSQLVKEFKKFGDGNPSAMYNRDFPVLLNMDANGDYLIIDGQHRVEACKTLNVPIVAIISDKQYTLGEIININTSQKGWSCKDMIESHAKNRNNPNMLIYQEVLRIINTYKEIPYTTILSVLKGRTDCGNNSKEFIAGKFSGPIDIKVYDFLAYATKCLNSIIYKTKGKKGHFVTALYSAYRVSNFDKERFLDAMSDFRVQNNYLLNCIEIERVYNRNLKKADSKIRLLSSDDYERLLKR